MHRPPGRTLRHSSHPPPGRPRSRTWPASTRPSDIVTIQNARFFVSAGYERMMSTIQEGIPSDERVDIHITTENDRRNVALMADLIASYTGTDVRYEDYVEMMDEAARRIEELGLDGLRVWCQGMLTPMAEDLGLDVVATFSGELTPSQIEEAASGAYDLILDNYHNPSTSPLEGVVDCPIVTWRNFPETAGRCWPSCRPCRRTCPKGRRSS